MSLSLIIEQIARLNAKVLELRERSRQAADDGSGEFFRVQAGHFEALKTDLEAMRVTLGGIEARAKEISSNKSA